MPNGFGVPLGCAACKHHKTDRKTHAIYCNRHEMEVSLYLVCWQLEDEPPSPSFQQFATTLDPDTLYMYAEVQSHGHGYAPIPKVVPLAPVTEFKQWNERQKTAAYRQANQAAEDQYRHEHPEKFVNHPPLSGTEKRLLGCFALTFRFAILPILRFLDWWRRSGTRPDR